MRTVCFVDRLEFDFQGNIFNQAIVLADVDNDGVNELVVGNVNGHLLIFKGNESRAWKRATDLGMITCIGCGDLFHREQNHLMVLTAEGLCHIFTFDIETSQETKEDSEPQEATESNPVIKPSMSFNLYANNRVMLITDVDDDGKMELIIGYSDRVVRLFRWVETEMGIKEEITQLPKGDFVEIERWQLAGHMGSLSLNKTADGKLDLMAAQPGGTFVTLIRSQTAEDDAEVSLCSAASSDKFVGPTLIYHPLGSAMSRNNSVTTEIIGCIKKMESEVGKATYSALCTLDGTLILVEDDQILWSLQVDHQLFALNKLDITGNGQEEVIVCSWDGQTYIVNHSREVVRFHFEENVAAFSAGHYGRNGENTPCFVYATFNGKIFIYYNITMPTITSTTLVNAMSSIKGSADLLSSVGVDATKSTELRQLYQWCLYGQKAEKT